MAEDLLEEIDGETEMSLGGQEGEAGKKGLVKRLLGNKRRLILIVLALVLVMAAAAGAWVFFFSDTKEEPGAEVQMEAEPAAPAQEIVFEDIVVLEPFERIPLKEGSALTFISLTVALELTDHRYRKQVYTVQDRLSRVVSARVREMSWLELRSPEGKIKLKYDILAQMNRIFPKVTVRNIYFTNFLMQ